MDFFKKLKLFIWSKHFLKHFGLVILFYLVIISVTIFYLDAYTNHGEKIKVPNYLGKTLNSVKADIDAFYGENKNIIQVIKYYIICTLFKK